MSEQAAEKAKIRPDISNYVTGRSASGAKTMHRDDAVARGLDGMTVDEVKQVASALDIENVDKYDHLNIGQQRMNLGNRIRGAVSKANKIFVELETKANAEEATAEDKKNFRGLKTGDDQFDAAILPVRKAADARLKEVEAAAKAKADAKAKAAAAKKAD